MKPEPQSRRQFLVGTGTAALTALSVPARLSAAAASPYEKVVRARKPVGYWRLGEARGPDAADGSGHGRKGIYHGKPAYGGAGAIRGDADPSVTLGGKRSYVEIPSHKAFSQPTSGCGLSVEVWVRPDALDFEGDTDDPYIHWLGKGGPGHHEWAFRFYSRASTGRPNRISAYVFNPEGGRGAGAYFQDCLTAGEWMHVVACFDPGDADTPGAGVRIYRDGVLRSGPPSRGVLYGNPRWRIKPVAGAAPVRLGTRDPRYCLAGALDEVAIYPRVLTAGEVLENYKAGRGG